LTEADENGIRFPLLQRQSDHTSASVNAKAEDGYPPQSTREMVTSADGDNVMDDSLLYNASSVFDQILEAVDRGVGGKFAKVIPNVFYHTGSFSRRWFVADIWCSFFWI
jgi:hypothetical protein